jgi:hypothetical protein
MKFEKLYTLLEGRKNWKIEVSRSDRDGFKMKGQGFNFDRTLSEDGFKRFIKLGSVERKGLTDPDKIIESIRRYWKQQAKPAIVIMPYSSLRAKQPWGVGSKAAQIPTSKVVEPNEQEKKANFEDENPMLPGF